MPSYFASVKRGRLVYPALQWMQAKVLPIKFRGQKFCRWPVDRENLKIYIPQNMYIYGMYSYPIIYLIKKQCVPLNIKINNAIFGVTVLVFTDCIINFYYIHFFNLDQ